MKKAIVLPGIAAAVLITGCSGNLEHQSAGPDQKATQQQTVPKAKDNLAKQTPKGGSKPEQDQNREPKMSVELQNAIASAQSYVDLMGFSKEGLVDQLTFEGYPGNVARKAVNHLDVNWKAEAVESARSYMETMAFSRSGLIEQLVFEGFSRSRAEYAASKVF